MNVSVLVICLNEVENISACLESLVGQAYPGMETEIIVVDGNSSDGTTHLARQFVSRYPQIKLIIETRKGAALARNTAILASNFDHIAFIDADCVASENWLETLISAYLNESSREKTLVAVGGKNLAPPNSSKFVQSIEVALDSFLGSLFSIQGRQYETPRYVESLATLNVLYSKVALQNIGLYDDSLQSEAEDAELNYRLRRDGGRLLYVPGSIVWHRLRSSPVKWLKNMFRYGKGRARLLKRYPSMWRSVYLIPPTSAVLALSVLVFSPISFWIILTTYISVLILQSLSSCRKHNKQHLTALVFFVYLIEHIGYSSGQLYGLFNFKVR